MPIRKRTKFSFKWW